MKALNFYSTNEVKPCGWLKRQLEIQAESLSGNLDKVWPDVRDSKWIGGNAEGWERVPYWLDGFIPLAYLLENEDMIARAKRYIDAILRYQKPDGWICPCSDEERARYDTWAVQLISKVLVVYYECSNDERIPEALYRLMKNYYDLLSAGKITIFGWGKWRWFEAFIAIDFLKDRYSDEWITALAKILKEQGRDYGEAVKSWERPLNKWKLDTHIVNLAMMLKYEALTCRVLGGEYTDEAERLHSILEKYNGTPVGLFTGDECLSGLSPIQGTELCAVVEQMYSYEWLYACTGEAKWAQRLELLAFNALPATISDDMWSHQYVQMSNQIACQQFPGKAIFRTNGPRSHLFGLEPNYGCCTANFNQGWPKLAQSAFMHEGNTVVSVVPVPSEVTDELASVSLRTDYPFNTEFCYTVKAFADMKLRIRVPDFAKNLKVNGNKADTSGELEFEFKAEQRGEVRIEYDRECELIDRPYDLHSVRLGSLVFALPIKYRAMICPPPKGVEALEPPLCDYEYIPESEWSYALAAERGEVTAHGVSDIPFSSVNPPITIKMKMQKIDWGLEDGYETVCAKVPLSREPVGEPVELSLYPYGCAKLRMTEMPLVK